jgi:hypothetical protein
MLAYSQGFIRAVEKNFAKRNGGSIHETERELAKEFRRDLLISRRMTGQIIFEVKLVQILIIRHGESEEDSVNVREPLTNRGIEQSKKCRCVYLKSSLLNLYGQVHYNVQAKQ